MHRLALKAAVTETTDLGEFTAVAAAWSLDRQNERLVPGSFAATIERWRRSGKSATHYNALHSAVAKYQLMSRA